MRGNTRDLFLLAICLSIFFTGRLVGGDISLLAVGLFFGLLSSRYRLYLYSIVMVTTVATSYRSAVRFAYLFPSIIKSKDIIGEFIGGNHTLENFPITLPEWLINIQLPIWLSWLGTILMLVFLIVVIILVLLPALILAGFSAFTWITFFYLTKPILFPEYTLSKFANLITTDEELFFSMLGQVMPWYLMYSSIVATFTIPLVFYLFLKKVGFYKRIPGALPT